MKFNLEGKSNNLPDRNGKQDNCSGNNKKRETIDGIDRLLNQLPKGLAEKARKNLLKAMSGRKITRREFLKGIGIAGLLGLGAVKTSQDIERIKQSIKILEDFFKGKNRKETLITSEKEASSIPIQAPTPEQKIIEKEEEKSITEILNYYQTEIHITLDEINKVEAFWQDGYQNNPSLRRSFIKAYFEMGAWEKKLRSIFREELKNVLPARQAEELMYLAIPESHWKFNARSRKKAVGPYQIIKSTARKYGLKINNFIDERIDPELSARACARIIKDLLKDFNGDLDLAISGYNGSFVYKYKAAMNGKNLSYEEFLKYIEKKINQIKKDIEKENFWIYKIHRGDILKKISKKIGVSGRDLCRINNIDDENKILIGQKIKIPIRQSNKEKIFFHKLGGIKENLVYPAKYKAIMNLIHQKFVSRKKKELHFQTIEINSLIHRVKRGENLYRIAQKYGIRLEQLIAFNPKIKENKLPVGYWLVIPPKYSNLAEISRRKQISLSYLKKINPAIKNIYANLPIGFKVRI